MGRPEKFTLPRVQMEAERGAMELDHAVSKGNASVFADEGPVVEVPAVQE